MIYLSIHGIKDGQKTFNCGTRYDWYLIQKKEKNALTFVDDEKRKNNIIDMEYFNWLPNSNIELIKKIINKNTKCKILCDFSYSRLDKK